MRFWTTIGAILVISAVGLTYEIAAGRVLAPFYGTSLVTWTIVIATVLAGFAAGSAWGGLVAERPRPAALAGARRALVVAAVLMAASPLVLGLVHATGARGTGGLVLAAIAAFGPASVAISLPSPLLAKIAVEARPGREGSSLGLVLAAGSLGAILGAVVAGFAALPLVGSTATFAGCGLVALACLGALRGGGTVGPAAAALVAVVVLPLATGPVCGHESGLSCIDVVRRGGTVELLSDRTRQAAERIGPDGAPRAGPPVLPYVRHIWARMERDLGPAPAVLFIGGGGYTLPARLLAARPGATAVAVEIDPLITEVARDAMPAAARALADPRLTVVHADGRAWLEATEARFDAAVMDAFSSGAVPAHLATHEAYARLRARVDGPVYVNLIDRPDGPLVRGVHAILTELYPFVEAVRGPVVAEGGRTNTVLAAAPGPLPPGPAPPEGWARVPVGPARAFTDDRGWVGHR